MPTPVDLTTALPCPLLLSEAIRQKRNHLKNILQAKDDRLIVVIGPCSIHDPIAALEYAQCLSIEQKRFIDELIIVMRVYFLKPRTELGWKGMIYDPYLDQSFQMDQGLYIARDLLLEIGGLDLAAGVEFLDLISYKYIEDLVSWAAIGARTTTSQIHRELASDLNCPVGFKNDIYGNIKVAIEAIKTANHAHHFLGINAMGRAATVTTNGNLDCHLILRGGLTPNYHQENIALAAAEMINAGLKPNIMIDASHANCHATCTDINFHKNASQIDVCNNIVKQISCGTQQIIGVMIESNLYSGSQKYKYDRPAKDLIYGQSITDACINWEESKSLLEQLANAVVLRRNKKA